MAFERLELYEAKVSRTVLESRGGNTPATRPVYSEEASGNHHHYAWRSSHQ